MGVCTITSKPRTSAVPPLVRRLMANWQSNRLGLVEPGEGTQRLRSGLNVSMENTSFWISSVTKFSTSL